MTLDGTLDIDAALADAPVLDTLEAPRWELPGARLVQASFEIAEDAALAATPPSMHPSIPPYGTFSVLDAPESPVGAFALAQVRIVARAGIRPRGFLIGAMTDSADAAAALASNWGFRVDVGEVTLRTRHDHWIGTAVRDGVTVMETVCRDPEVMNGADVDLIANLNLARHDGEGVIVQVDPEYVYHEANRGRAELTTFVPDAWGTGPTAGAVLPTSPAVAIACRVDTDLPTPRFVMDPVLPAIKGTRRLSAAAG